VYVDPLVGSVLPAVWLAVREGAWVRRREVVVGVRL
jgi:hypothetical protein